MLTPLDYWALAHHLGMTRAEADALEISHADVGRILAFMA